MKTVATVGVVLGVVLGASTAMADGKMYSRETVPPEIPYQRALILFRDGTQTMILQSQYRAPNGTIEPSMGWVVPVPAVPQLGSMPADDASRLFSQLGRWTSPRATRLREYAMLAWWVGTVAVTIVALALRLGPWAARVAERRVAWDRMAMLGIAGCMFSLLLLPTLGHARGLSSVEVVVEQKVGVYDVQVVRSSDSGGLVEWLNGHAFRFTGADRAAFDSYLARGWCFVVARMDPRADTDAREVVSSGLAAPLIMRFATPRAVYPLALTATGGHDTEVLIYVASQHKMRVNGDLELRHAGYLEGERMYDTLRTAIPDGFFSDGELQSGYTSICKFKGRLTPEQMRKDAEFTEAADDEPYRSHEIVW